MTNISHLYIDASFSPRTKKAGWCATLVYSKSETEKQKTAIFYASLDSNLQSNNCVEALACLKALSIVLSANLDFKRLNIHIDSFYAINFLYKHYHKLFYFYNKPQLSRRLRYSPYLVDFPVEEDNQLLIKSVMQKFQERYFDIGVFHVRSHVERHPINIYNYHEVNNNKVDEYAKLARIALEAGNPIKLQVIRS